MALQKLLGCDSDTAEWLENSASSVPLSDLADLVRAAAGDASDDTVEQAVRLLVSSGAPEAKAEAGPTVLAAAVVPGGVTDRDRAAMATMAAPDARGMKAGNTDVGAMPEHSSVSVASTSAAAGRRSRRKAERRRKANAKVKGAPRKGSSSAEEDGEDDEVAGAPLPAEGGDSAAAASGTEPSAAAGAASALPAAYNESTGEVDGEVTLHVDPDAAELDELHIFAAAGSAWRGRAPEGARRDLTYHNLNMASDKEEMLVGATLRFRAGRRYGLVGRNGVGKSTLLRHIAGRRLPFFPKYLTTVMVQSEAAASDETALETVLGVDKRRGALLEEEARVMAELDVSTDAERTAELAAELGDLSDMLEQTDAAVAETRAAGVLTRLGFDDAQMRRPLRELSGGWRMRVSLAMALFLRPDLLLLDEPETHLSMDAVLWLQDFVKTIDDATVVIVSHNRAFLDATVEEVCYFHSTNKKLEYWPGNYSAFRAARDSWVRKREHMYDAQEMKRAHLQDSIENIKAQVARAGNNRMKGGQIRSRKIGIEKKLGAYRLENGKKFKFGLYGERSRNAVVLETPEPKVVFRFPAAAPPGGGGALLGLEGASFSYGGAAPAGGRHLLNDVTVTIGPRARIAVLGCNGAGKSTLLKMLKGEAAPLAGRLVTRPAVRVAHFAQYHVDMLEMGESALDFFLRTKRTPEGSIPNELDVRTHLARFGVCRELPMRPMSTLSGGQRSKVAFAAVMWEPPHVFLVDEGSHHLDVAVLDALGQALRRFEGAVVLVSHDEYLIRDVCEKGYLGCDDTTGELAAAAAAASASGPAGDDDDAPADNAGDAPEYWVVEAGAVGRVDNLDQYLEAIRPSIHAIGRDS